MNRCFGSALLLVVMTAGVVWVAPSLAGCRERPPSASGSGHADMPAVSGPSVLVRLGIALDATALGKQGGEAPAPATGRREPMSGAVRAGGGSSATFSLTGADLYRLDCQSCHGPDGRGAPPEITSLLDPVRGTSAALLTARLRQGGHPVDEAFVRSIAAGAEQDLLKRLANGGKEMPAFAYLRDDERSALVGYLERLAAVPEAPAAGSLVVDSAPRVGELVVAGTCHICHDATGPRPSRMGTMMSGALPPLSSFVTDYTLQEVIAKVREGRSAAMSGMMMRRSPRMPRFPYLTRAEIAAGLVYLNAFPPEP